MSDGVDFQGERYKHILNQMARIDENAYKFLSLFQAAATGIFAGICSLWLLRVHLGISNDLARFGIYAGLAFILLLGASTILLIVIGMFAWMDFRREEATITSDIPGMRRGKPSWKGMWRWQESYILLLVGLVVSGSYIIAFWWIIPSLP